MAFTAVGALVSGSAAVTAGTILAAVAEVGLALSVVGGVTGNKTLLKIGGAMSLVGGVGGMLAGGLGSGASAASSLAETGADAATSAAWSTGADVGMDTMTNMGLDSAASTANSGIISGAQSGMPDLASGMAANHTDMALQAGTKATPGQMAVGADTTAQAATDLNAVSGAQTPVGVQTPAGAQGPKTPFDVGSNSLNAPQASGSFFGNMGKLIEGNKTLFNSGLQLVGGAMKGASESAMFDKKVDLEQQRINQTKFGNSTSAFQPRKTGIIAGAQAQ